FLQIHVLPGEATDFLLAHARVAAGENERLLHAVRFLEHLGYFFIGVDARRFLEHLARLYLGRRIFLQVPELHAPVEKRADHGDFGVERHGRVHFGGAEVTVFQDTRARNFIEVFLGREVLAEVRQHRAVAAVSTQLLRSEEHTSELQSRENLVCRLLLEKKKQKRLTKELSRKK